MIWERGSAAAAPVLHSLKGNVISEREASDPGYRPLALRLSIGLAFIAAMNLAVGVCTQILVLREFSAGASSDAFVAAQAVPGVVSAIVVTALLNVWQPLLSIAAGPERSRAAASGLGQTVAILAMCAVLLTLTCGFWTRALFPGLGTEARSMAVGVGPIMFAALVLTGTTAMLGAVARAEGRFLIGEGIPALVGVATLPALPAAISYSGLEGAAWLLALRSAVSLVLLAILLRTPWPRFGGDPLKRQVLRQAAPILAGSSIYKCAPLLDRYLASQGSVGNMALFNLAQNGAGALITILDRAFGVPIAPALARSWVDGDLIQFRGRYRRNLLSAWLVSFALAATLMMMRPLWETLAITILHVSGHQAQSLYNVAFALLAMVAAGACGAAVAAAHYASGDTRTPVIIGIIGFIFGFSVKIILFTRGGIVGLAWANSIHYVVNLIALWALLERKVWERTAVGR